MSSPFAALTPQDAFNRELGRNTHPDDYVNPTPKEKYNLVVIGAGTAGLVTAAVAAGLGARVALVERALMGGDCLNVGCVPSKGLISAARVVANIRRSHQFGVEIPTPPNAGFALAMERMRRLRSEMSAHDSVARFNQLGVDVFLGQANFVDSSTVNVQGARLRFSKAVICTGARAAAPPIRGLREVSYLTNETLFSLTDAPKRLGVIGAGPIGCEMSQAFAQFSDEVYLVESSDRILPRDDADAAAIVQARLESDGVKPLCCGKDMTVTSDVTGAIQMRLTSKDSTREIEVDKLLVAVGRKPNVEGLGLEKVGVDFTRDGVVIDDRFRTTNPRIFAAGDICSPYRFTHAADFMARSVVRNALFKGRAKHSKLLIPWATYTTPEIAHIGLSEKDANDRGIEVDTYTQPMAGVDRAVLEGETEGFVKIHVTKGKDRILGATIVAPNAGDMIGTIAVAMTHKIGLGSIANAIHPYPTQGEAIRKAGDLYNRTRFTPLAAKLFEKWFAWQRR